MEKRGLEAALLDERIRDLKRTKLKRAHDNTEAKFFLEGEVLQRTWINANKNTAPWNIITTLKDKDRPDKPLIRRSDKMANLVGKHHDHLQKEDQMKSRHERKQETADILRHIKTKICKDHRNLMNMYLTKGEVTKAIESLSNRKVAGLDGIPQEIWKNLLNECRDNEENYADDTQIDSEASNHFDVAGYLTDLYNDIEAHGVETGMGFADGWLCPIYKKGDQMDIGNYRLMIGFYSD